MNIPIVMIIGTPRSGTSLLGRLLDLHPRVATWVEPYYIWDHHFRESPHDQMSEDDTTDNVRLWIRRQFIQYRKAFKTDLVVDKSPRNCLKIPFVNAIFPEARYIVLFRDGRDAILSIRKQWKDKSKIFAKTDTGYQWKKQFRVFSRRMSMRPLWRYRIQSLFFEIGPPRYWPKKYFLNQIRWEGRFGWGPRFKGWQELIDQVSTLEFSAHQWVHCARGIIENASLLPEDRVFTLKYEDLIINPEESLKNLFSFLNMDFPALFMETIPEIWSGNSNKWQQSFSSKDLKLIGTIIGKTLIDFGYEKNESWF